MILAAKYGLALIALALLFTLTSILRRDSVEYSANATIVIYSFRILVILGLAWYSYYRRINMRVLVLGLIVLVVLKYALYASSELALSVISSVVSAGISGLCVVLIGSVLWLFSVERIRLILLLAVALATFFIPSLHRTTGFSDAEITQFCLLLLVCFLALFIFVEKRSAQSYAPAKQVIGESREAFTRWFRILFAQRNSSLITPILLIPYFFCYGLYSDYSLEKGFSYPTSDTTLYLACALVLILYVLNRVKPRNTWFNVIYFSTGIVFVFLFFFSLVLLDIPVYMFVIMASGIFIVKTHLFVFLSEASSEHSISPVFVYGSYAFVYLLPHALGSTVSVLVRGLDNMYATSILSGASLAAIAIGAGAAMVFLLRNKNFDQQDGMDRKNLSDENEPAERNQNFELFCEKHGISSKESEVIWLYSHGRSARSISKMLYISESTTKTYIQRVYTKLDVHNRQELLDALELPDK